MTNYNSGDIVLVFFSFRNQTAISTIEQTPVLKKLGRLSPKDLVSMENTLKEFLYLREIRHLK